MAECRLAGRFLIALVAAGVIAGCAQRPPKISPAAQAVKKKIALLHVRPPALVRIVNAGSASDLVGAPAGAIRDSIEAQRSKEILGMMTERKVRLDQAMVETLQESLENAGYQVRYLQGVFAKWSSGTRTYDYSAVQSHMPEADSILDVRMNLAGFLSGSQ